MPNTLSDLNQYANTSVVYTDDRAYSITFSANAASNTSTTINEDQTFVVPTGINITNVISQPGNITYTVSGSTANIVASWPNPLPTGISNTSPGNGVYSITGTFDGVTWAAAKQLSLTAPDRETPFTFVGNIQYPNPANTAQTSSWSWTNSVTIANTNPDLSLTTSYNWAEDTPTTFVYSIQDLDPTATYTLTFDQFSGTSGIITVNGNSFGLGNTATVTGNRAAVNAANVVFNPYPDATDNVGVYVSAVKTNPFGNVVFANNVVTSLNCTSTHSDYSLTTDYTYTEDTTTNMVFDILDTDTTATGYTVRFDQVSGNTGVFFVNGTSQGVGNAAVLSNSKANINAANVSFLPAPDDTGNIGINYTQIKTTPLFGNVTQVSNVAVNLTNIGSHVENSLQSTTTYNENTRLPITITDTDARATSYTMTLLQTQGNIGTFLQGNTVVSLANVPLTISNTRTNINSSNISWQPVNNNTGNVTLQVSQSKVNSIYGNVTQLSNVAAALTIGNTTPEISNMIDRAYTGNTVNNIFATSTPSINDGPDYGQIYSITLSSAVGKFGNSAANAVAASSYSFTGNITQVNAEFANMKFVPTPGTSSNSTFAYTQSRSGVQQVNTTHNLTGTPGNITPSIQTFSSPGTTSFTPTFEQRYYGNTNVLVVGGGGGGSQGNYIGVPGSARPGGGGGGGGQVRQFNFPVGSLPAGAISLNVGAGGNGVVATSNVTVTGASGGTSWFMSTANQSLGGTGGQANVYPSVSSGGASGNAKSGGSGATRTAFPPPSSQFSGPHAGGGGGDSANGGSAVKTVVSPTTILGRGGTGGDGTISTLSGSSTYYGGGGAGGYGPGGATAANGGQGGGGSTNSVNGVNGTGGGGAGGGSEDFTPPGQGGSGVVIINIT